MASVTPVTAFQDSTQNTASTIYTDASCETAALTNGVEYMVHYGASHGANSTSRFSFSQLLHGSTQIAEGKGEGFSITGTAGVACVHGARKVTGNGTDTLKWQHKGNTGAGSFDIGAMWICAIPMTEFGTLGTTSTEGDYYFSGTNSATHEQTDVSTGTWATLRSMTCELAASAKDYLIFASCEGLPDNAGNDCNVRLVVDGVTHSRQFTYEGEDPNADQFSFAWATLDNLSGNVDIDLEVLSGGAAETDYLRSNIFVVSVEHWNQIVSTVDTTTRSTGSATPVDITGLTNVYTPNQSEYVLTLLSTECSSNSTGAAPVIELRNETTVVSHRADMGGPPNNSSTDALSIMTGHVESRSAATTYTGRMTCKTNLSSKTIYVNNPSEMIQWGLTTAGAAPPASTMDPILMSCIW